MSQIVLDLDDFHEGHCQWSLLTELHKQISGFKVNLFTIPGRCSLDFVTHMRSHDWIDLIPHGWAHQTNTECKFWTEGYAAQIIEAYEGCGFTTKGFKAPGWQISNGCYAALLKAGYWCADQNYNNHRRPKALRTYLLDSDPRYTKIHGHIGHLNGHNTNELEYLMAEILTHKDQEFAFIRDIV